MLEHCHFGARSRMSSALNKLMGSCLHQLPRQGRQSSAVLMLRVKRFGESATIHIWKQLILFVGLS